MGSNDEAEPMSFSIRFKPPGLKGIIPNEHQNDQNISFPKNQFKVWFYKPIFANVKLQARRLEALGTREMLNDEF